MQLPILCYHKVSLEPSDGRWLNIHPRRLRQHLKFFIRRGCEFKTVGELSGNWPRRGVCLTFDDAYISAMTQGVEVLNSLGARSTFYVVSDRVGQSSSWDGKRAAPLADWDLLVEAARTGHEIGNHTATHVHMGALSHEEQVGEIKRCKEVLAARGFASSSFCYPYGDFSEDSSGALNECGYKVAVVIGKRAALPSDPLLALPRIVMAYGDSVAMLLYKLHVRPKLK